MSIFIKPDHTDRIDAMVEEFYKNYKPDFVVHPLLEKTQANLLSVVQDTFSKLRFDFEDQKKVCDIFKFRNKTI